MQKLLLMATLASCGLYAGTITAATYQCTDAVGKTSYRDTPCHPDQKTVQRVARSAPATSFDQKHAGTYALIHKDGHTTDFLFHASVTNGAWKIEQKNQDGTWSSVTCESTCQLVDSSSQDVSRFFPGSAQKKYQKECIHNSAFAFCHYVPRNDPNQMGYVIIDLVTGKYIPMWLKKVGPTKQ